MNGENSQKKVGEGCNKTSHKWHRKRYKKYMWFREARVKGG